MFKLTDKKIITILCSKILLNWPYVLGDCRLFFQKNIVFLGVCSGFAIISLWKRELVPLLYLPFNVTWLLVVCFSSSQLVGFLVCFVALHPKSTAMVIVGQSVHLTTLFPWQAFKQAVNQYCVHILLLVTDNNPS